MPSDQPRRCIVCGTETTNYVYCDKCLSPNESRRPTVTHESCTGHVT